MCENHATPATDCSRCFADLEAEVASEKHRANYNNEHWVKERQRAIEIRKLLDASEREVERLRAERAPYNCLSGTDDCSLKAENVDMCWAHLDLNFARLEEAHDSYREGWDAERRLADQLAEVHSVLVEAVAKDLGGTVETKFPDSFKILAAHRAARAEHMRIGECVHGKVTYPGACGECMPKRAEGK